MNAGKFKNVKSAELPAQSFDLFRLSKSKEVVDLCSNTIRKFNKEGLPFYRRGKAIFISKSELDQFIRSTSIAKAA